MKYFFISICLLITLNSCNQNSTLVEVAIPEPEIETTQSEYSDPKDFKAKGKFQLVEIPYAFDDLDKFIDGKTMELHYSKHYLNYTNQLNGFITEKKLENASITHVLSLVDDINPDFKNNAGGYYNHTVFFESLTPNKEGKPSEELTNAFISDFGSFDAFKQAFIKSATNQFGSGWTWLIVNTEGKLQITNTNNQDNPLMFTAEVKGKPILCLDLWEHAYYLKYQNNRKKYIDAFFNVIHWELVSNKYSKIVSATAPTQTNLQQ